MNLQDGNIDSSLINTKHTHEEVVQTCSIQMVKVVKSPSTVYINVRSTCLVWLTLAAVAEVVYILVFLLGAAGTEMVMTRRPAVFVLTREVEWVTT